MKNRIYTIPLLLTAAALLVAGCSSLPLPNQATPTAVPEPLEDFIPLVSAIGEVVPEQQALLSVSTAGIIEEVFIEEGDIVLKDVENWLETHM